MKLILVALLTAVSLTGCKNDIESNNKTYEQRRADALITLCVSGYTFIQDRWSKGQPQQVIDSNGKGIPCQQ